MQTKQQPNAFKQRKLRLYEEISQEKSRVEEDESRDKDKNEALRANVSERENVIGQQNLGQKERYCA